jgi:hypothetical protein
MGSLDCHLRSNLSSQTYYPCRTGTASAGALPFESMLRNATAVSSTKTHTEPYGIQRHKIRLRVPVYVDTFNAVNLSLCAAIRSPKLTRLVHVRRCMQPLALGAVIVFALWFSLRGGTDGLCGSHGSKSVLAASCAFDYSENFK